ncbi:MAG TPA: hypothetical protein VK887_02085 [Pseudonocardiaceae bacterium]|nr:hypothetical protein [Pseudonocardiaceae bacterium]
MVRLIGPTVKCGDGAVTGHPVSPPLCESMGWLGRDRSLHRLRAAVQHGHKPGG